MGGGGGCVWGGGGEARGGAGGARLVRRRGGGQSTRLLCSSWPGTASATPAFCGSVPRQCRSTMDGPVLPVIFVGRKIVRLVMGISTLMPNVDDVRSSLDFLVVKGRLI